ncbi:MAG: hypothetical protein GXY43_09565 [Clostridiaceae bacterium]|nr:hypothetical protein [Clostridiaceae bacterium]
MKNLINPKIKRFRILTASILCVSVLMMVTGCFKIQRNEETETSPASSEKSTVATSPTESETEALSETETSGTDMTTSETTETVTETQSTLLTDINSVEIYSSYAHLETFDPITGLAGFDYFDMLTGQEAIDWLVEHEGYTQADAEDLVNNFADTEYVEKNINPRLRMIDMRTVFITTNIDVNGYLALPQEPMTYSEFSARSDEYLQLHNYSRIIVEDNEIVEVIVGVFMG